MGRFHLSHSQDILYASTIGTHHIVPTHDINPVPHPPYT